MMEARANPCSGMQTILVQDEYRMNTIPQYQQSGNATTTLRTLLVLIS